MNALTKTRPSPFSLLRNGGLDPFRLFDEPLDTHIEEREDAWVVETIALGYEKDEINVDLDGGTLTLSGEVSKDSESQWYKKSFRRSYRIPQGVDRDAIEAELRNGILSVRIPKAEDAKPRRIEVKVE